MRAVISKTSCPHQINKLMCNQGWRAMLGRFPSERSWQSEATGAAITSQQKRCSTSTGWRGAKNTHSRRVTHYLTRHRRRNTIAYDVSSCFCKPWIRLLLLLLCLFTEVMDIKIKQSSWLRYYSHCHCQKHKQANIKPEAPKRWLDIPEKHRPFVC